MPPPLSPDAPYRSPPDGYVVSRIHPRTRRRIGGAVIPVVLLLLTVLGPVPRIAAQELPKEHGSRCWDACPRCRTAYKRALEHTLRRLPQASFPAKMIMGWTLLADGRHPRELETVIQEARRWRARVGTKKAHNHRRNWYPALAGMLLAERVRYVPDREIEESLQEIVDHFAAVQERTGGWFKWFEGAYNDRPDYAVKDLGMLDAIILGFLHGARALGLRVPGETMLRAEACMKGILSSRGISYGTGSRGGDVTGARGAFAMNGLLHARCDQHQIVRVYTQLLPRCIPKLDQGHHVGGLHCLGVTLGCHLLGRDPYRKLVDAWLDPLIERQLADGGVYVGDDEDAGGERGLLGEDDASTAAFALMILLQDPSRLRPWGRPRVDWLAVDVAPPASEKLVRAFRWAACGKLERALAALERLLARRSSLDPEELADAELLSEAIDAHLGARLGEARRSLEAADILHALDILEPLARALPKRDSGLAAAALLRRVKDDATLRKEHAAQKDLERAWKSASKKGLRKARAAFEALARRYPDTVAGRRAAALADRW